MPVPNAHSTYAVPNRASQSHNILDLGLGNFMSGALAPRIPRAKATESADPQHHGCIDREAGPEPRCLVHLQRLHAWACDPAWGVQSHRRQLQKQRPLRRLPCGHASGSR